MPRYEHIEKLRDEPAAVCEVRIERGGPRLYLNGREVVPLLGWSWALVDTAPLFKKAGIDLLHPILGLNAAWPEPGRYDFSLHETFFDRLLAQNPEAYFLPRVHLDVPLWWKEQHPQELIHTEHDTQSAAGRQYRPVRENPEGGFFWGIHLQEPSLASEIWRRDMDDLFQSFLRHFANSPLRSRIIGYQIGCGIYGEWHYFLAEFLPDSSAAAKKRIGPVPDLQVRINSTFGLLRDPGREAQVINFYRRFHEELIAEILLHFAELCKQETQRRILCGAFYAYLLENVWIHEGGHLAPAKVLNSSDIDFLASPYSYQTTNAPDRAWWEHDVYDGAGNWLGRTRGVAGDGGYRVLLESLRRHGKLFFVELDAGTYLEPPAHENWQAASDVEQELCMIGGAGSTTREGTIQILRRDLGQMFVQGNGGWLFDFGPVLRTGKSWYADAPILAEIRRLARLGALRENMDLFSCAEAAAVYDAKSLFVTRHWRAEAPFPKGGGNLDFFSLWFLNAQARALHRLGAPVDFLYRFDLKSDDMHRYRLLFMVNLFYLTQQEVAVLRQLLKNSGMTVVWFYAPGFVSPEKIDILQMQELTGFEFEILTDPGLMMIECEHGAEFGVPQISFGANEQRWPRFCVRDGDAEIFGVWQDHAGVAFAAKAVDGWRSVYLGTAPLPPALLRFLAKYAGMRLWSSRADIVRATRDAAMLVATSDGARELQLPVPMAQAGAAEQSTHHALVMRMGEVKFFASNRIARFL